MSQNLSSAVVVIGALRVYRPNGKGFYLILADEVREKFSNQEVMSLCLRFVDESQAAPCTLKALLDFVYLKRTTGENISGKIIEILTENNVPVDKIRVKHMTVLQQRHKKMGLSISNKVYE